MKTKQLTILLGLVLSVTPSFGQRLQITDWMAFDKAKNHFVATERIQKKGDKARMLKEANVVVDSLIAFARRTGNSEEIIIDTELNTPRLLEWPHKTYSSVGKKTARVKVMEDCIGSGDSLSVSSSFKNGIFLVCPKLWNRQYTSETEFPSYHQVSSKYWSAGIKNSQIYNGQYNFSGIRFVAPCPQDMVFHYKSWSPFDGIAEQWTLCLDAYLLISVTNKAELLYSIVDIRDAGDHEEFYLTVSEEQAEEMGISKEDYAKLRANINDEQLVKVIFPDKKTIEMESKIFAEVIKQREKLMTEVELKSSIDYFNRTQKEQTGRITKEEWSALKQKLKNKEVSGGIDLNNLVNGELPVLISPMHIHIEEK